MRSLPADPPRPAKPCASSSRRRWTSLRNARLSRRHAAFRPAPTGSLMGPIKIAIVGLGKIARDQHVPSLRSSAAFELVAVASPHHQLDGTPSFGDLEALLQAGPA